MNILINNLNKSGEGSEEEQIEVIPSTNTSIPTPTSSRKLKKKGIFRTDWLSIVEYSSWLQEVKHDSTKIRCKPCLKTFSVHFDGKSDNNIK
jgi:hypothetical protein